MTDPDSDCKANLARAISIGRDAVATAFRDDDAIGAQDVISDILHYVKSRWPDTDLPELLQRAHANAAGEIAAWADESEPV